jgi:5-methylthioribose kinase
MLHGDLHTGSVMVSDSDIRVIDPEFVTYGPIGFDVGMLIANFLMAYLAQPGHASSSGERDVYGDWVLGEAEAVWAAFAETFAGLWQTERTGMLYPACLFEDQGHADGAEAALAGKLAAIWRDALGFCGVEIHRRILGLAHNADFEQIADVAVRAACEARALELGRRLVHGRGDIPDMATVTRMTRQAGREDHL